MWRQLIAAAIILLLAGGAAYWYWPEAPPVCQICLRPMHSATSFFVHLENGNEVELCCPRCGLRFHQGRDDVLRIEVADYQSRERMDARAAVYVVGASVHPCCSESEILKDRSGIEYERTWDRCLPSVIAFESQEEAEAFQKLHGGQFADFERLRTESAR